LTQEELISRLISFNRPFNSALDRDGLIEQICLFEESENIERKGDSVSKMRKNNKRRFRYVVYLVFFVGILWIYSTLISYYKKDAILYCKDKNDLQGCFPCPINANCANGSVNCERGYVLSHGFCIHNHSYFDEIGQLINLSVQYLTSMAGRYRCGSIDRDWMSVDHLESALFDSKVIPPEFFDEIFHKSLDYLRKERFIIRKNNNNQETLVSLVIKRPLGCEIRLRFLHTVVFSTIVLLIWYLYVFIRSYMNRSNQKRIKLKMDAQKVINQMGQYSWTEISEHSLTDRYKDNKEIDFSNWKGILDEITKSKFVQTREGNGTTFIRFIK